MFYILFSCFNKSLYFFIICCHMLGFITFNFSSKTISIAPIKYLKFEKVNDEIKYGLMYPLNVQLKTWFSHTGWLLMSVALQILGKLS